MFHSDVTINGEQTLKVDGNLSIQQYGGGFGGDLDVVGSVKLASGYTPMTSLPAGVTGGYHGPVMMGAGSQAVEFFFEKTGNENTADFIVPIGAFPPGPLEVSISPLQMDPMSGSAYYSLGTTRFGGLGMNNQVTALRLLEFGGGCNAKLLAYAVHGSVQLYLQYDARSQGGGTTNHGVKLQIKCAGSFTPGAVYPLSNALPLKILNSVSWPYSGQTGNFLGVSTTAINTDKTILEGQITIASPQGDISMGIYGGN